MVASKKNLGRAMPVGLIAAAGSLVVQAVAGLWPMADGIAIPTAKARASRRRGGGEPQPMSPVLTADEIGLRHGGTFAGVIIGSRKKREAAGQQRHLPAANPPSPAQGEVGRKAARMRRRGGWLLAFGILWTCSLGAVVPILTHVLRIRDQQWLVPAISVPNSMMSIGLIVWGSIL